MVNSLLRVEEIVADMKKVKRERELRHFFGNRLHWEDLAQSNDKVYEEFQLLESEKRITEEQYTRTIFEKAKRI